MKYFAYGSNMLSERIRRRVPDATVLGVGSVRGRCLRFWKRSVDGSGKCDIPETHDPEDVVYGLVYELPDAQLVDLDRAEGLGQGYDRAEIDISVGGRAVTALVYLAASEHTASEMVPYDWYHELVLAGAREHGLPRSYLAQLAGIATRADPKPNRKSRLEALDVLNALRVSRLQDAP